MQWEFIQNLNLSYMLALVPHKIEHYLSTSIEFNTCSAIIALSVQQFWGIKDASIPEIIL